MLLIWLMVRIGSVPGCDLDSVCCLPFGRVRMMREGVLQEVLVTNSCWSIAKRLCSRHLRASCAASHSKGTWASTTEWEWVASGCPEKVTLTTRGLEEILRGYGRSTILRRLQVSSRKRFAEDFGWRSRFTCESGCFFVTSEVRRRILEIACVESEDGSG